MTLRFESAINPYGCSSRVVEAMAEFARSKRYNFYGEATADSLRKKLAAHFALTPENFVIFNGSGDALAAIYLLYLVMKKGTLIAPYPSYERFVEGAKRLANLIEVPLEKETWALPLERLIDEARTGKATLGIISSPNNPTGNILLDESGLKKLLTETPDCLWIVDEAYADYPGTTFAHLVDAHSNLVILRTFSKAYGMAGLRVGYAITDPVIAGHLSKLRLPWAVNSMSLTAAEAALDDQQYLGQTVQTIKTDRQNFFDELSRFEAFTVYPSDANFFLIEVKAKKIRGLPEYLSARGITVRTRPDMPAHFRVTSLLPAENQILISALREFGF